MRLKKTVTASALAVLLVVGAATVSWSGGASAAPGSGCPAGAEVKGTIVLLNDGSTPQTGTATGSFAGAVVVTRVVDDFDFTSSPFIRSVFFLTITPQTGAARTFSMDFVAWNWTATGLIGGGLLSTVPPDPGPESISHVFLGPMDGPVRCTANVHL